MSSLDHGCNTPSSDSIVVVEMAEVSADRRAFEKRPAKKPRESTPRAKRGQRTL